MNVDRPITGAYIKQEAEDSKEYLKRVLYSPVKVEAPSLEISGKCWNGSLYTTWYSLNVYK